MDKQKNTLAPVVLFVYNRLDHTKKTVEALQKNTLAKESDLYIFADGFKGGYDKFNVNLVRKFIQNVSGFKKVTVVQRDKNFGLAASVIDGVTSAVKEYGRVIVLEDDLVTAPLFLQYMNDALEKYKDEKSVYSITGYSFSDESSLEVEDETYFLPITSSWSWATWESKWNCFNQDYEKLRQCIGDKQCKYAFDFENSYPFSRIAKKQLGGKVDSWAIFWYFSVFSHKGLTLYPKVKLVKNIGHDGSGTHCNTNRVEELSGKCPVPNLTEAIEINEKYQKFIQELLHKENNKNNIQALKRIVKEKIIQYFSIYIISRVMQLKSNIQKFLSKKNYGKNSFIDSSVQILGYSNTSIGNNSIVSEETWINVNHRGIDTNAIVIGDNCYIGRRNFFSSAKHIILRDYCMTGVDCQFLGSGHNIHDVMMPYISTGTNYLNIIDIGANVWIGARVIVLGDVSIGYGSVIGAGSLVTKDISPFSLAVGSPAKVIKRFSFEEQKWLDIKTYENISHGMIPTEEEYLSTLKKKVPKIFLPLQASSKKFGDLI